VVAGKEWAAGIADRIEEWMHLIQLTLLTDEADKDADMTLTKSEMTAILPEAQESIPDNGAMSESLYWIRELDHDNLPALEKALVRKNGSGEVRFLLGRSPGWCVTGMTWCCAIERRFFVRLWS